MNFQLIRRLAMRDLRAGEMGLLLVALLVAVGTVTSISLFVDRLQQALVEESANLLAADRQISSSREIPDNFRSAAQARGIELANTMVFPSMVFAGDTNQLVSVKAVDETYPLRGRLTVTDVPFERGVPTSETPAPGEIWLDSRLFPALGVALGDSIEVGLAKLRVTRVLVAEPDRGGSFFDLGPRLLMNLADVPATQVVQPGSRLSYRLLLRGADDELGQLRAELDLKPGFRWIDIRQSSPRIGSALDRAESFLLLGGLLGVLLAGVAVALSAHRYAVRHYDHVGILKTLGATPNQILLGYLNILLLVGLCAVILGLAAGGLLHFLIVELLSTLIPIELPSPGPRPFLLGAATGLICALAFAMPAFIHLRDVSPMRVIRRDPGVPPTSQLLSYGAAIGGSLFLLVWYTEGVFLPFWTLIGSVSVIIVFGALAYLLLRGGRVAGMQARSSWRLALSGLQRRRKENTAQIITFGLAIMLLLVLLLIRTDLITDWQQQIPEEVANHFLLNIAADEVDSVRSLIEANATTSDSLHPMMRGRIVGVNGLTAQQWEALHRNNEYQGWRRLSAERNLTWTASPPGDNHVIAGEWWSDDDSVAAVSLEREYAASHNLRLGDVLEFDIGGQRMQATVTNLRALEWERMRPNFFIILSPGAVGSFPATYMTSFYLDRSGKSFLNTLLSAHPTITVIEIDALIEQVQRIINQVSKAVELVLALVLVSGCLVLIASIQASRDSRMGEHALVRALGGTRRLIGGSLLVEFAVLGTFSGIVAVFGAEVTVALLQSQVFELDAKLHFWMWPLGPLVGASVITIVGLLGSRSLVDTPPMLVLRDFN